MAEPPCAGQSSQSIVKTENEAVQMYRFAALMLGNEAEALSLVENAVAAVEIDPCADPSAARGAVRDRVLDGALGIMYLQDPASFSYLPRLDAAGSCIEDDGAPPLSRTEISKLLAGAGRGPLREWLNRLSQAQRAVFVQRAVLGSSNADTARAINRLAGPSVWSAKAVSNLFRQALCSLASSMVHSTELAA